MRRAIPTTLLATALLAGAAACGQPEGGSEEQPRNAAPQTAPGVQPAQVPPPPGTAATADTSLHQPSVEAGTQPVDSGGGR